MSNFLEAQPDNEDKMDDSMSGVRIIRTDELTRIQLALSTATDALMKVEKSDRSERVSLALCEISAVACLIGGIALTNDRRPPAEFAERLETQTRIV